MARFNAKVERKIRMQQLINLINQNVILGSKTPEITVDDKTYAEEGMQFLYKNRHCYLLVKGQSILIKWLDDWIGVPYI